MKKLAAIILSILVPVCMLSGCGERSGAYPSGSVEVIVPYKQGGTTDLAVRGVLDSLSEEIPSVTVSNIAGGSGLLGTEQFVSSRADGYTLGVVNCDLVLNYVTGNTDIDPLKEFTLLAAVEQDPYLLLADSKAEFATFAEFLTYCEENPDQVVVGVTGVGTVPNLLGSVLVNAGLDVKVVACDSATDALNGVLAGETDMCISAMAPCVDAVDTGELNILAVTSAQRSDTLPQVPTMAEVDERFADVNLLSWIMLALPAGTDDDIVSFWQDALAEAIASTAYARTRESFCFEEITLTAEALTDFVRSQAQYYKTLNGT